MLRRLAIIYIYTKFRAFSPPRIVSCLFLFFNGNLQGPGLCPMSGLSVGVLFMGHALKQPRTPRLWSF